LLRDFLNCSINFVNGYFNSKHDLPCKCTLYIFAKEDDINFIIYT